MAIGEVVKLTTRRRRGGARAASTFPMLAPEEAPSSSNPWWRPFMDDDAHQRITIEIERTKGQLSAHERECAVRYEGIHSTMTDMKTAIDTLLNRERVYERHLSKLQIGTLVAVISLGVTVLGWMAVQLYHLEPARVAAAVSK
jgi:hypothetical protein